MQSKSLENNGLASRKSRKYQRTRPRVGTPKSSIARRNRSSRSPKHIGDLAELEFLLQAASRGFPVGKPFGDNEPYDCLGRRPHPYLAGAGKDRNPLPQSDLLPPQPLERSQAPRFLYTRRYRLPRGLHPPPPGLVPDSCHRHPRPSDPQSLPLRSPPQRRPLRKIPGSLVSAESKICVRDSHRPLNRTRCPSGPRQSANFDCGRAAPHGRVRAQISMRGFSSTGFSLVALAWGISTWDRSPPPRCHSLLIPAVSVAYVDQKGTGTITYH